jgi:hypothetical protein
VKRRPTLHVKVKARLPYEICTRRDEAFVRCYFGHTDSDNGRGTPGHFDSGTDLPSDSLAPPVQSRYFDTGALQCCAQWHVRRKPIKIRESRGSSMLYGAPKSTLQRCLMQIRVVRGGIEEIDHRRVVVAR